MSSKWVRRGMVAAAIGAFVIFRDELPDIDLEEIIKDLSEGLGAWTYLLVAVLAFLETGAFVGLVAPGEFTVILGGAVAGQGDISLSLILAVTWLSAFLGDSVSFMLGAKLGRGFLIRHGARVRITEDRLKQVEGYFARHGGKTILIGRFIGLVRALAPFIAGTSKMPYRAFAPYSVLGTGLWATAFILVGYFASQSLDTVAEIVGRGLVYFGFFVGFVVGAIVLVRYLRRPRNREKLVAEIEQRRSLRPLLAFGRRLRPQAVFFWQRLTPGGLGLELTTLLAVAAVGLFILISYWSVVGADPVPTPGDETALDWSDDLRVGSLDDAAKAVTVLGAVYVVLPLAALAAIWLGAQRRWSELCVLAAGMLLIVGFTDAIKGWTERPRPSGGLVEASSSAFPSAHAAYATFYTWLGVTLAFRFQPGITRRTILIVAGLVVAALVGLSRVYLRVHWFSDVSAGWGLGLSALASVGAVALVLVHIRDNPRRDDGVSDSGRGHAAGAR